MNPIFKKVLLQAMTGETSEAELTAEEWAAVYRMACQQSLVGVLWTVAKDKPLPLELAMQWVSEAEAIRGLNALQNAEAAQLTRLFAEYGRRTVILKGQANARLYPDPLSRQPGDIDIWVEGGRESVVELLLKLGLLDEVPTLSNMGKKGKATTSYHHVHLPPTKDGIVVEVHFRPSSGNFNPITNRRLQRWLEKEMTDSIPSSGLPSFTKGEEFNSPSMRFALMMQLAHIQRHFLSSGVGLRQICDYYLLLKSATDEDRQAVSALLKPFGLSHTAGALMWLLGEVLHMKETLMLCQPDSYRGEWMLREVMAGGNFGHYAKRQQKGIWRRFFAGKCRQLRLMRFNFSEVLWCEMNFWKAIVKTLPTRIRYRTLSLRDIPR